MAKCISTILYLLPQRRRQVFQGRGDEGQLIFFSHPVVQQGYQRNSMWGKKKHFLVNSKELTIIEWQQLKKTFL